MRNSWSYLKNADKKWLVAGAGLLIVALGMVGWYTYGLLNPNSSAKHNKTEKVKSANKVSKTSPDAAWIEGMKSSSTMILVPNASSSTGSSSSSSSSEEASSESNVTSDGGSSSADTSSSSDVTTPSSSSNVTTETITNPTTKKTTTITYATDGSATAVTNLAKQLAKNKISYASGGSSLDGLDQVGLVNYVYGKTANLALGNSVSRIKANSNLISVDKAKAGDLLFWGTSKVAIYLGNGDYVEVTDSGVTTSNFSHSRPDTAGEVLK